MANYDLGEIDILLDKPSTIISAASKVSNIERGVKKATKALQDYMLDEGVEIAKSELVRLIESSEGGSLHGSIKKKEFVYDESKGVSTGYITAGEGLKQGKDGMTYAVYVEYGTGSKKKSSEKKSSQTGLWSPKLNLPAKANAQETPQTAAKPMHFFDEDEGKWYTTYGQSPKPFMANAMYKLMSEANKKAAELVAENLPHEG